MNLKTCVLLSAVLYASPVLATPIVSVAPRAGEPAPVVGNKFTVDFSIAQVTDLITFEFSLEFDPDLMSILAVEPGSALDPFDPQSDFFTSLADLNIVQDGQLPNILGALGIPRTASDGVFASLTFLAKAPGESDLKLSDLLLVVADPNDPFGGLPVDDFNFSDGSVTVAAAPTDATPVPEPATMLLVGTGLAAVLRKHRARPSN